MVATMGQALVKTEPFRIGPGYVYLWMHIATEHCALEPRELTAMRQLGRSLGTQIHLRDEVEAARRAFIPASPLAAAEVTDEKQSRLVDATKRFFLHFYSLVSDLASVIVRFPEIFGSVPSRRNSHFIEWLASGEFGFMQEHFGHVRAARDFRTLLDHTASFQPYGWGVFVDEGGFVRALLHGPPNRNGNSPEGASPRPPDAPLPADDSWIFYAPDEDIVLSVLAVQLNFVVSWVQVHRDRPNGHLCSWIPKLGPGDPVSGYPILAIADGEILGTGPMGLQLSAEDRATIDGVLSKYLDEDSNQDGRA